MKTILVDTKRFIEEMGDPGFMRIDSCTGKNGEYTFVTMHPPELDKDFIPNLINKIERKLK